MLRLLFSLILINNGNSHPEKIPIVNDSVNAALNGCLVGIMNSDVKSAASTQGNLRERLTNNIPTGDLVLESYDKGFVITRLTTTQRNAMQAVEGMLIYNTTENCFQLYNGTTWNCIQRAN